VLSVVVEGRPRVSEMLSESPPWVHSSAVLPGVVAGPPAVGSSPPADSGGGPAEIPTDLSRIAGSFAAGRDVTAVPASGTLWVS